MNIPNFVTTLARNPQIAKSVLTVRKYSPEILTAVGIVGVIGAGVLGARATLRLEDTVDRLVENRTLVKDQFDASGDERERNRAMARVFLETGLDFVKLYGPTFSLAAGSIACIVGAHGIMRKRNVALLAAYKTLETAFQEYRKRVVEEFGPDKDRDFHLGFREERVEDPTTGKKTKVRSFDPNMPSPYARFFDDHSSEWVRDAETNLFKVRAVQAYANEILKARGYIFLNEVYKQLGLDQTATGQIVGWWLGGSGDDYIDFGVYNFDSEKAREFVNGREYSILLDFNVDGTITNHLPA